MTTLTTSGDILDWMLFNANEPADGTSDFHAHAIACLNRAYREIWTGGGALVPDMYEPWLWLKKDPPGVLTLNPVVEAGTINVANNSASITFSSAPALSMQGRFFKVATHPDIFRIAAHTGGNTAATLDGPYTGPTATAAAFRCMQLEYTLAADALRVISPMRIYAIGQPEIDGVDLLALERDYPLMNIESGTPTSFAMVTETKLRFNRYGGVAATEFIHVEYDYLAKPSAELDDNAVEPLVPLERRQVLADAALMYLLMAKSDNRVEIIGASAKSGLKDMQKDNRQRLSQFSRNMGAIHTRQRRLAWANRPLRTTSGFIIG